MHVFVAPMLSCCSERDKVAQRRGNEKAARGDTECQVARAAGLSAEHNVVVWFGLFCFVFFEGGGGSLLALFDSPSLRPSASRCCRKQRRGDGESEPRYGRSGPGSLGHRELECTLFLARSAHRSRLRRGRGSASSN